MKIEVNGKRFDSFTSASVTLKADALAHTFSFSATSPGGTSLPFGVGDRCVVYVDGTKVLTGNIELMNIQGDATSHTIDFQGRSTTGDLLDSEIGPLSDFNMPISLKTVCERVINHLEADEVSRTDRAFLNLVNDDFDTFVTPFSNVNAPSLKVIDEANTGDPANRFKETKDKVSPEPGQNAFEFLDKLGRKRQVILTCNADGDLLLRSFATVGGDKAPSSLQPGGARVIHNVADITNNVLTFNMSYDTTGRFNRYISSSQPNVVKDGTTESIEGVSGDVEDTVIRKLRQKVLVSENAYGADENLARAQWERNIRRARGRIYSCVVNGFRDQTGSLWTHGTLVRVDDVYAKIKAGMFLKEVSFDMSVDQGRTTTLTFMERDAYTLALNAPLDEEEFGYG